MGCLIHFQLNKFADPDDGNYEDVGGGIARFYQEAIRSHTLKPDKQEKLWVTEQSPGEPAIQPADPQLSVRRHRGDINLSCTIATNRIPQSGTKPVPKGQKTEN